MTLFFWGPGGLGLVLFGPVFVQGLFWVLGLCFLLGKGAWDV